MRHCTLILLASLFSLPVSAFDVVSFKTGKMTLLTDESNAGLVLLGPKGKTRIEVIDKDEDGVVDLLRYYVFSTTGEEVLEVEDYDMDGQADRRWHHYPHDSKKSFFEMWKEGGWRRIYMEGGKRFVVIDNKKIPVVLSKGQQFK